MATVSGTSVQPMLVFDGDCGFCTRTAHWIAARWTQPAQAEAWQRLGPDGLDRIGLTERDVRSAAYWIDADGRVFRGHAAVAKALCAGTPRDRTLGALLLTPPVSWLARRGYRLVARYRYRLPGATDACRL
jgi:predicted DCC family thiol-disulfide oxidoreductase YuxK